jgi:hypothetical protein
MSLPLLGNDIDLRGSLSIDHEILSKGNNFILKIKSLEINDNELYNKYLDSKKIGIELRIACDSTFFEKFLIFESDFDEGKMEISFKKLDLNNDIQISYYLKSLVDFDIEPDNSFNEFYNTPMPVISSSILSVIYNLKINVSNNSSLRLFNIQHNENATDYMDIKFNMGAKILIELKDIDLFTKINRIRDVKRHQKAHIHFFFMPIILHSLELLKNKNDDDFDSYKWEDKLLSALDIDIETLKTIEDFDTTINLYFEKFLGEEKLSQIYKLLK